MTAEVKEDQTMMRVRTRPLAAAAIMALAGTFATAGAAMAETGDGGVEPNAGCGQTKSAVIRGAGGTIVQGEAQWTLSCPQQGYVEAHGWIADQLTDGYDICVREAGLPGPIARTQGSGDVESFWWRTADSNQQMRLLAYAC